MVGRQVVRPAPRLPSSPLSSPPAARAQHREPTRSMPAGYRRPLVLSRLFHPRQCSRGIYLGARSRLPLPASLLRRKHAPPTPSLATRYPRSLTGPQSASRTLPASAPLVVAAPSAWSLVCRSASRGAFSVVVLGPADREGRTGGRRPGGYWAACPAGVCDRRCSSRSMRSRVVRVRSETSAGVRPAVEMGGRTSSRLARVSLLFLTLSCWPRTQHLESI